MPLDDHVRISMQARDEETVDDVEADELPPLVLGRMRP
jgi:hypothetical protein